MGIGDKPGHHNHTEIITRERVQMSQPDCYLSECIRIAINFWNLLFFVCVCVCAYTRNCMLFLAAVSFHIWKIKIFEATLWIIIDIYQNCTFNKFEQKFSKPLFFRQFFAHLDMLSGH